MEMILKKLHITVPIEIFDEIYKNKDMNDIDNLITQLLCRHYGIDLTGSTSNGKGRKIEIEKDRK